MKMRSLCVAAAVGAAMLGIAPAAAAQPGGAGQAATTERDLNTNTALLSALIERRAEVERGNAPDRAKALAFLDRQIAIVRIEVRDARARHDR
jgi:hypothetical protein